MKLGNRHVFKMVRIIKKAEIRDFIVDIMKNRGKKDKEAIGISIFDALIEIFSNEEMEILLYDFLADISKKSTEEIAFMPIEETKSLLTVIAEENNLNSFFQSVSDILKKN